MSRRPASRPWLRAVEIGAAVTGAAAAATAAGLAAQRKVARSRARRGQQQGFGTLRSQPRTVRTEDGVALHVEVDEPDPGAPGAAPGSPTLVFVHGYVLTMDAWHFQRLALRGRHRMVFYDQRSHGRSGRSDAAHTTLEQCGRDLAQVLDEVAPPGPVVLIGHSMGGMTLMSLAEQLPEVVAERVAGAAFLSTSAGGVGKLLPGPPGRVLDALQPLLLASLARVPLLVDTGRRSTAYALTSRLAFGGPVPDSYTVFVDRMISETPSQVIWDFLPSLRLHRRYGALAAFADLPAVVIAGDSDAILPVRHGERITDELPHGRLLVVEGAGHMVLLERPDEVTAALAGLVDRASSGAPGHG